MKKERTLEEIQKSVDAHLEEQREIQASDEWKNHLAERKRLMDELGMPKDWTWADPDHFILYGVFRALEFYVYESGGIEKLREFTQDLAKEDPADDPSGGCVSRQVNSQQIAVDAYMYWTVQRPLMEENYDKLLMFFYGRGPDSVPKNEKGQIADEEYLDAYKVFMKSRDLVRELDDEWLNKIMSIRGGLWT